MPFLLPVEELLIKFEKSVAPMISQIEVLVNKNQILQETRDLLLPRLISGKLSVENIDLEDTNTLTMAAEPKAKYNEVNQIFLYNEVRNLINPI